MRLLVVSHACVTPINQQLYASVEEETGWDITLVVPDAWRDGYGQTLSPDRWPSFGGQIQAMPVWRSGNVPLHVYRDPFVGLLKDVAPHAVYVHNEPYAASTAQVYAANRVASRVPFGFYSAQNIAKRYPPPFRWTERAVLGESAFAFPVSTTVASVLQRKGFEGEAPVLPLSLDPELYRPTPAAEVRADLGVLTGQLLIGYLGRVTEEKGLATLAYALDTAVKGGADWRLAVVGSGPYERELDHLVTELGLSERVVRTGFVPHTQAPRYLSAFDVLAVPSETRPNWKEQFGRVIVEALSCGTVVVGSDSGEIPHLIKATGGGLIFPEGDPAALATQLHRVADAAFRSELAGRGRAAVLERYSQSRAAHLFAQTVETAVSWHTTSRPKR